MESAVNKLQAEVVFLPTLGLKALVKRRKTRIHICELRKDEYLIVTRPLWARPEDIKELATALRNAEVNVIPSLQAYSIIEAEESLALLGRDYEAIELDFTVPRGSSLHLGIAPEIAREVSEMFSLDVYVKLPVFSTPPDILERMDEVKGVIFAPHVVYTREGEYFRVHSTVLSRVAKMIIEKMRQLLPSTVEVGFVVEDLSLYTNPHFKTLAGISVLAEELLSRGVLASATELGNVKWIEVPPGLGIVVKDLNVCPFGLLEKWGEQYYSTAKCDACGVCMSLCKEYKIYREIKPE